MCLAVPYKVIKVNREKIELDFFGEKRSVNYSLIKIKPGDFALLQNNIIIKKLSKEEAEETLKLFLRK